MRLSDYGLMPIQSNHAFMVAATPGVVGISRWLAPELIDPPRKRGYHQPMATEQADIFAFAMLVIEVFTGELPFGDVRHESAILKIVRGQRPEKPHESCGLTPEIWKFLQKCWHQHPTKRPHISAVVSAWRGFDSRERFVTFNGIVLHPDPLLRCPGQTDPQRPETRPTEKSRHISPLLNLPVNILPFDLTSHLTQRRQVEEDVVLWIVVTPLPRFQPGYVTISFGSIYDFAFHHNTALPKIIPTFTHRILMHV